MPLNNPPEGLDDFMSEPDPQTAIASQGFKQLLSSGPSISKAPEEGVESEDSPIDYIAGGLASKIGSSLVGEGSAIVNNEIGSIGKNVAKELPMDEVSRLARAKEMGFNTDKTYYHGTKADIKAFKEMPNKNGRALGNGTYLAERPQDASDYAIGRTTEWNEPGNVLPVHINTTKTFNLDDDVDKKVLSIVSKEPEFKSKFAKNSLKSVESNFDLKERMIANLPAWRTTQILQDVGYDSLHSPADKTIVVFDPKNIRSKFATFDPNKKDSSNIAAGLGAIGLGTSASSNYPKQQYALGGLVGQGISQTIPPLNTLSDEPSGLNEFIGGTNSSVSVDNSASNQTEPAGLDAFIAPEVKDAHYGTLGQQLKAGAEGLAQGLVGPLAPLTERALGVKDEDIRGRAEANPITHYGSEIAGLVGPAFLTGGASLADQAPGMLETAAKFTQGNLLEKAGSAIIGKTAGETLASKIGTAAAKGAIDNMLLSGSDETSRLILNDPGQSAETAAANIGLSGLLGAGIGGALGAAGPAFKMVAGNKLGQVIEDFKGRISDHINNPDPVNALTEELSNHYANIKSVANDVYGPQGLKAQDIEKALPGSVSPQIRSQANSFTEKMEASLAKLQKKKDSLAPMLEDQLLKYKEVSASEDPKAIFNASQDLKQQLQEWGKYNKTLVPLKEKGFRDVAKDLAYDIRIGLEDSDVWGKAAERQQAINKAFTEFKPALTDFESKFTSKVGDERQIDPGKINTYLNQLGKPNAEIKQKMLSNFLDASEKYQNVINDSHTNLGLDSPIVQSPLNTARASLEKKTTGSKLADLFIQKGLTDTGGKVMGAAVGAGLGHALGAHGEMGALIGEHALGPFFSSVLPAITKPLITAANKISAAKAAIGYGVEVAKGEQVLNKAAKNIFKVGSEVISNSLIPSDKDRLKLNNLLKKYQVNSDPMFDAKDDLNHYMPDHASALNQTKANAIMYLNSLRADMDKKAPLDPKPVPSSTQKAAFRSALDIAQSPLIVLDKIKNGSLTAEDIKTISSVYPNLYNRLQQKLNENLIEHINKGESVPYRISTTLSMFLAQPMDSSFQPQSIIAAQSASVPSYEQQPQQSTPRPKGSSSSPALQKMSNMYKTPGQSSEERKNKV